MKNNKESKNSKINPKSEPSKVKKEGIQGLFVSELKDILSAEKQIIEALPKMVKAAESKELKEAFTNHLEETRAQVKRLEKIFSMLKMKAEINENCEAMEGLIKEGEEAIKDYDMSAVRDANLISKAQRIEHYEISVYGTLRTFAKELGLDEAVDLLQETLDEEGAADKKLTKIAEGSLLHAGVNQKANNNNHY